MQEGTSPAGMGSEYATGLTSAPHAASESDPNQYAALHTLILELYADLDAQAIDASGTFEFFEF
jgi:hypothetical protein